MKAIQMKDLLNYRFLSDVKYAPDGNKAAFVVSYGKEDDNKYEGHIWIWDKEKVRQLTGLGKERSYVWEDCEHLLFAAVRSDAEKKRAEAKDLFTSFYRISIHGGEATLAFTLPYSAGRIESLGNGKYWVSGEIDANYPDFYKMTEDERKDVLKHYEDEADYQVIDETPFWMNGGTFINKKRDAFFIYDDNTRESIRITPPLFAAGDYTVIGEKVYYTGSAYRCKMPLVQEVYVYNWMTGEDQCIYEKMEYNFGPVTHIGNTLILEGSKCDRFGLNENAFFLTLNEESGEIEILNAYEHALGSSVGSDMRLGGGYFQESTDELLYFTTTRRNASHVYTLDLEGKVAPFFEKEGSVDCLSIHPQNGELLMVSMQEQKLQELYLYSEKNGLKQLTHFNEDALKENYVAVPEKMTIQSQGVDIDGWVIKPIDFDETKSYPSILDIHGGPKTVYGEVFYHEMQVWAGMGYFVFFCNPTGSDGRGNEFADIRGKYGTIDFQNIMDFTDAVLEKYPMIDRKRVGETGGSYGGFMTNWIVGHTDRFACVATQRSISNWISFYGISDIGTFFATDQNDADFYEDVEQMWEHSPLKYAQNVKTPVLFIHSDEDYRCPMAEAMQFYTALADHGVEVRMCYFKGENHELSRSGKPKHRLRRLTEITNWMERFLK